MFVLLCVISHELACDVALTTTLADVVMVLHTVNLKHPTCGFLPTEAYTRH